jgi:hypothetical protein
MNNRRGEGNQCHFFYLVVGVLREERTRYYANRHEGEISDKGLLRH